MRSKVLIASLCALALACGAKALYHFRINLPDPCDVIVSVAVDTGDVKTHTTMRMHGMFEQIVFNVTNGGASQVLSRQLVRPDFAEPGKVAKMFEWSPFGCDARQMDKDESALNTLDFYFTNKEPGVFHGTKCTVMFNATDPDEERFFVDEELGVLLGFATKGAEGVVKLMKAIDNKPEKFVFDKKAQPTCDGDAFVPPTQAAFDAACKHSNNNKMDKTHGVLRLLQSWKP